jgi:hypothetical protein
MCALFDMYKVDFRGPAVWLGSVHSYSAATFGIQLSAARAPGDYAIVNRQTGERTALSFGLSVDGRHDQVTPISHQGPTAQIGGCDEEADSSHPEKATEDDI